MRVAVFDLDGTVLRGNSWHEYFRWSLSRWPSLAPALLMRLAWRYARLITPRQLREAALRPLRGLSAEEVAGIGSAIYATRLSGRIRCAARREIGRANAEGFAPVLATGGFDFLVEPIARDLCIREIVCSRLTFVDGRCCGRIEGEETRGVAKAEALRRHFSRRDVDWSTSRAYSDDFEDRPLLEMVGEPVLVGAAPQVLPRGLERLKVQSWTDS